MNSKLIKIAVLTASTGLSCTAFAHTITPTGSTAFSSFFAGFAHPFSGLDHLAAMLAVGLWSALTARRAGSDLLWAPAGFMALLLVGAVAGMSGSAIATAAVEPMIAASLLVTGLLVLTRWRLPGLMAAALVGVFAVFHGLAHGQELAGHSAAWATLAGMMAATAVLHSAGMGIGWALRQTSQWPSRAAGASVALLGLTLLARLA
jgi:urease accessory protein